MKSRKSSTSLHEHYHLTPDLLSEILARVPPKTLLQFRCVCKCWCSLIDSRDFISMHLNLYPNNRFKTQLLVQERVTKTCIDTIYTIRRSDTFRKIGQIVKNSKPRMLYKSSVIHGLMLMANCDEVSLWNPSIRKSLVLPRCPFRYNMFDVRCLLGFAPSSKDYKVVFFKLFDMAFVGIAIYSLHDHHWRVKHNRIQVPQWCFEEFQLIRGVVFAQGTVYWRPSQRKQCNESSEIVCFDFDVEEIGYCKLPDMEDEMFRFLFVVGGSLAVLGVSSVRSCIWVMEKSDGKEMWHQYWERDTNLDVYEFFNDFKYTDHEFLYIEDTGILLIQSFQKLMAYNIRTNQAHCLEKSIPLIYVGTYVESLVLHKGYKGAAFASHARITIQNG